MDRSFPALPFFKRLFLTCIAGAVIHAGVFAQEPPRQLCGTLHLHPFVQPPEDGLAARTHRPDQVILGRPTVPGEGDRTNDLGHSYTAAPKYYVSPGGHFKIWYVTTTEDRPGAGWPELDDARTGGVPQYVRHCATFLDESHRVIVEELGYRPPPVDFGYHDRYVAMDSDDGGDGLYDVYISDLPSQFSGYSRPEAVTSGAALPSYIVVDNDFAESRSTLEKALDLLRITLAHEYFHAVQFGYDAGEEAFWLEQSAVWIEEQVYDEVDDYLTYLPTFSGFLTEPWISLDASDGEHEYAGVLWPLYLEKRHDRDLIRSIWERAETSRALDAIDGGLRSVGSDLASAFQEFTMWNVFTGDRADPVRFYEEGAAYPPVELSGLHGLHEQDPPGASETYFFDGPQIPAHQYPGHLAANYIRFVPDSSLLGGLRIDFTGITGEWGVSVVASGDADTVMTVPSTRGAVTIDVPDWTRYETVMLVVASLDRNGDGFEYAYTATFDPGLTGSGRPIAASLTTYPNPFYLSSGPATVRFVVGRPGEVRLTLYNVMGRRVRTLVDGIHAQGTFTTTWDGKDDAGRRVASGVYLCRMTTEGAAERSEVTRKLLFLK